MALPGRVNQTPQPFCRGGEAGRRGRWPSGWLDPPVLSPQPRLLAGILQWGCALILGILGSPPGTAPPQTHAASPGSLVGLQCLMVSGHLQLLPRSPPEAKAEGAIPLAVGGASLRSLPGLPQGSPGSLWGGGLEAEAAEPLMRPWEEHWVGSPAPTDMLQDSGPALPLLRASVSHVQRR